MMGLLLAGVIFSVWSLLQGEYRNPKTIWKLALFLYVTWQAFSVKLPLTPESSLISLQEYRGFARR